MALAAWSGAARAHQSSVTYVEIAARGREVAITLQVSNLDLAPALGLERDRPADAAELGAGQARLGDYLAAHIAVSNGGFACTPRSDGVTRVDRAGGFFAVTTLRYECKRTAADVTVRYDLFFDLDPRHQGLARVLVDGQPEQQAVFHAEQRELKLSRPVGLLDHVRDYLVLGVEHIFTGYDHLAFLFGLLVVAGFARLRDGLRYVLGVVTAFTVAHSCTLIAAGLGWVRLSPRLVEPAIALSIAYVAVENLLVARPRHRWLLTFGFGLVHGFGFASVLREIGLPPRGLVLSLLSFNIGVELGQLSVVALVAPALWLFTRWRWEVRQIGRSPRHSLAFGAMQLAALAALAGVALAVLSRFGLPLAQLCIVVLGGPAVILAALPRYGFERTVRVGGSVVLALLASFWFFERVLGRAWLGGQLG